MGNNFSTDVLEYLPGEFKAARVKCNENLGGQMKTVGTHLLCAAICEAQRQCRIAKKGSHCLCGVYLTARNFGNPTLYTSEGFKKIKMLTPQSTSPVPFYVYFGFSICEPRTPNTGVEVCLDEIADTRQRMNLNHDILGMFHKVAESNRPYFFGKGGVFRGVQGESEPQYRDTKPVCNDQDEKTVTIKTSEKKPF